MQKRFKEVDDSFVCDNCNNEVKPLGYTSRNHCPKCLYSKHVDINPGDRLEMCKGVLKPIGIEKSSKGIKIVYTCEKCGKIRKNISANDDNMDVIIQISSNPIQY